MCPVCGNAYVLGSGNTHESCRALEKAKEQWKMDVLTRLDYLEARLASLEMRQ